MQASDEKLRIRLCSPFLRESNVFYHGLQFPVTRNQPVAAVGSVVSHTKMAVSLLWKNK